jgi:hypothetical protein
VIFGDDDRENEEFLGFVLNVLSLQLQTWSAIEWRKQTTTSGGIGHSMQIFNHAFRRDRRSDSV